jgi:hypothetical protein
MLVSDEIFLQPSSKVMSRRLWLANTGYRGPFASCRSSRILSRTDLQDQHHFGSASEASPSHKNVLGKICTVHLDLWGVWLKKRAQFLEHGVQLLIYTSVFWNGVGFIGVKSRINQKISISSPFDIKKYLLSWRSWNHQYKWLDWRSICPLSWEA